MTNEFYIAWVKELKAIQNENKDITDEDIVNFIQVEIDITKRSNEGDKYDKIYDLLKERGLNTFLEAIKF